VTVGWLPELLDTIMAVAVQVPFAVKAVLG
jgi:hypothetical protein